MYVGTEAPLVFIFKVYVPVWFNIKINADIQNGPLHLCKTLYGKRFKRHIVDEDLQRNDYFAHLENILIGMLMGNGPKTTCVRDTAYIINL